MAGNPPASPWRSTPRARRRRRELSVTIPDDARARLEELAAAAGETLSRTVERLIRAAKK